jgi:hypothetical protein
MPLIDFPSSPSEGDIAAGGDKTWKYTNGAWMLTKYESPDSGTIDAGTPSSGVRIRLNGGNQVSVFVFTDPIDGGIA